MNKLFLLVIVLFGISCQEAPSPSIVQTPAPHSISLDDNASLLPITAWGDFGHPLFDIEVFQERFHAHNQAFFEITDSLKEHAKEFLYPLSPKDFVSLFQDLLHKSNQAHTSATIQKQRSMHHEYLFSQEKSFHVEINYRGQGRIVKKPRRNGYNFDFITTYTQNYQDSFYQINALFFENSAYGTPKKWDDWYSVVTKGHIMCCASPTALATYHKTDSSEFKSSSTLLKFPYFKRTEVYKTLQNNQVISVDSSIVILKFGIYKNASFCDEKRYVNGRLMTRFGSRRLKRKLRY